MPVSGVGRVGFDCSVVDDRWDVGMYLGTTEVVGGRLDGLARHANFEIDVLQLLEAFCAVERFRWIALPCGTSDPTGPALSCLSILGSVDEHPISLTIHSVPPEAAGPGFREFPDGQQQEV